MSEEEAILQIELLNHDFFIFKNTKIIKQMYYIREKRWKLRFNNS